MVSVTPQTAAQLGVWNGATLEVVWNSSTTSVSGDVVPVEALDTKEVLVEVVSSEPMGKAVSVVARVSPVTGVVVVHDITW
jgi:hypothetical protein